MKRIIALSCILTTTLAAHAQEIAFEHGSFASVCAKAKAENKLVFIDFYTSWCGPCRHMAQTVFKEDKVGAYFNSHFVCYKLDAEKGEGKTVSAKYDVHIFPTYLFIDAGGAVFNKAIGSCADTVFLGYAQKATGEFSDPNSLPRLKMQYAARKKDTAFLRLYIAKLHAASLHVFEPMEQYLAVQTAFRPDSRAMLNFITSYPLDIYYGSRAEQVLKKYGAQLRDMADSAQRKTLELANNMLLINTRDYAIAAKSETVFNRMIHEWENLPPGQKSFYTREGLTLHFYAATENWTKYRPLANRLLDSISAQLKPIALPAGARNLLAVQTPEASGMRRAAGVVNEHAKIYREHFTEEKDVVQKSLRWVKAALQVFPDHPGALTFYANLLYENKDSAAAISTKIKALKALPPGSLHRDLVQTNLNHMQHGEALEEE